METPALSLSGEQGEIFERHLGSYERLSKIGTNLITNAVVSLVLKKQTTQIGEALP